jgi:hypothetical protein
MVKTNYAEISRRAAVIAGAAWDDRTDKTSSVDWQLRQVAASRPWGSDGDLTDDDRRALLDLADEVEGE